MADLAGKVEGYSRRPSVPWARLQAMPWWGQCIGLWLVAMVALTAVGLVAVRVLDLREGYDPVVGVPPDSIPGIWARWDSPYYINLARQGYRALPYAMGYFPLYPALISGLSRVSGLSLAMAGMLIAQSSYLAAILLFYKVARLIRDNHGYAMRCVIYMIVFPSSFFFFALYAEPLCLAFSVLGVYLLLRARPRYVWAGLALGLASAARPVGWLLNVVPLVTFVRRRRFSLSSLVSLGSGLLLSVSGVVAFVLFLYSITGTFLAIPAAQSNWQTTWQYPWITYWKGLRITWLGNSVDGDWFLYVMNWIDLLFITFALAMTVVALIWSYKQRFRWSLAIYLGVSAAFLLTQQHLDVAPVWGMARWVGALFPIYLILGDLSQNKVVRWSIALVSGVLLILFTAWWVSGRWVG